MSDFMNDRVEWDAGRSVWDEDDAISPGEGLDVEEDVERADDSIVEVDSDDFDEVDVYGGYVDHWLSQKTIGRLIAYGAHLGVFLCLSNRFLDRPLSLIEWASVAVLLTILTLLDASRAT